MAQLACVHWMCAVMAGMTPVSDNKPMIISRAAMRSRLLRWLRVCGYNLGYSKTEFIRKEWHVSGHVCILNRCVDGSVSVVESFRARHKFEMLNWSCWMSVAGFWKTFWKTFFSSSSILHLKNERMITYYKIQFFNSNIPTWTQWEKSWFIIQHQFCTEHRLE